MDLTDEHAVRRWVDAAAESHGGIDVLYANAGATRFGPLEQITKEDWDFNLRHELDVVFLPVKHAWRHLKRSSNASRGAGRLHRRHHRFDVERPRRPHRHQGRRRRDDQAAGREGAPYGIRVNCVSPGMVATPATRGDLLADHHPMRDIARAIPLGRVGQAEEVARCARFLASDEASYVTGANLVVDGGWSAVLPS